MDNTRPWVIAATLVLAQIGILQGGEKSKLKVKIIDRQDNATTYTYVLPGYSNSTSNTSANCNGIDASVNCSAMTRSTGTNMPALAGALTVRGATLSLLLPDGRVAVVNCESKFAQRFAGPSGNRRSCRIPINEEIDAEFNGNNAKLMWPVSLDGKKLESETYKVLGIFAARRATPE